MNLKTKVRQVDGIAVVDVSGRVTLAEETKLLRENVQGPLGGGQKEILLNWVRVTALAVSVGMGCARSSCSSVIA